MRIEDLRSERNGDRARVAATVTWEDCDRPKMEVYFETDEQFAEGLTCNPHAFLVGSLLPAMHHGEKRVFLKADVCPELRDNLMTAMTWIRHWYYGADHDLVRIEAGTKTGFQSPATPARTGFFFSGGIDSFGTLRANRLNYPLEHPQSIRDGLLIYGQNVESNTRTETFAEACSGLSAVARESGFALIPVCTNVRLLDDSSKMFSINHGAILGSVAHAFSGRLTTVCISASFSIPGLIHDHSLILKPYGSHPLLDPCYGSSDMRIRHTGVTMTRLDKIRLIADWDAALNNIRVCGPNWPGMNCGKCEKCVRTMLALLAAGALERSTAFPSRDVTADMVAKISMKNSSLEPFFLGLIAPLKEKGRQDLVEAVEDLVKRVRHRRKSIVGRLREIDSKYFDGKLRACKRALINHGIKETAP